jgi:vault protein inter-alpha-trypsin-like protein/VWA domain-containing protein
VKKPLFVLALAAGCGSSGSPTMHAPDTKGAAATGPREPMRLELAVIAARGQLMARTSDNGAWQPLARGASLAGVRELRADRRAAVVALGHGDAAGRLWLRAGASVRLGQDDSGVHLKVLSGRVRFHRTGAALPAFVDMPDGAHAIDGDYLIEGTQAIATGARPELAAWSLGLDAAEEGSGIGKLEARDTAPDRCSAPLRGAARSGEAGPCDRMEPLALERVAVTVKTSGDLAVTEVEHVFGNPADTNREGTFRFPVPDGAMLIGLAMEIDGKLVEGEIVEKDKAREVYNKIVDEMQDPALLEWEEGNWFKLRVFPIEAHKSKRVVIRYASPLVRGAAGWEYSFMLGAPAQPIGELVVTVDGKHVEAERNVATGIDVIAPIGDDKVPPVMREAHGDGIYTAVHIPAPAGLVAPARGPRRVAIVVDTSRSALEGKALERDLVKTALGELAPADRFVVIASDIDARASSPELVSVTPQAIDSALAFVDAIEPDGATDVGAMLAAVQAQKPTDVIYVGDGIPTWGERDTAALAKRAQAIGAPIHAGLVGKGASSELWGELAGRTGGRAVIVHRPVDAQRFALAATHAAEVPRLEGAKIEIPGSEAVAFPTQATTLYQGDELVAFVRTPADKPAPAQLVLTGTSGGKPVKQTISLAKPVTTQHVMQRWAAYQLVALDQAGATREDIVALSRDAGLMSRYTSLLVLENDEAYKRFQIERKQAAEQLAQNQNPQITGGDLDSLGAARPSLSPDEIQPGDPEIKIPAPRDAQSVIVSFPFGETKRAEWDDEVGAWMVRFLIDKDTPDGEYQVRVTITQADGRIQLLSLPYAVDTKAPAIELVATWTAGGYVIKAKQTDGKKDAAHVEIALPDGTQLVLKQTAWGRFEGTWQTAKLAAPVTLRAVVTDRALNQTARDVVVGQ